MRLGRITEGIDFSLHEAGSITGSVTSADTGEPLPRTWVCASGPRYVCTETNNRGKYLIRGLGAGIYRVYTRWSPYIDEVYDDIPCDPSCDVSVGKPVYVELGEHQRKIHFQLDLRNSSPAYLGFEFLQPLSGWCTFGSQC